MGAMARAVGAPQRAHRLRTGDPVDGQAVARLEALDGALGGRAVDPVDGEPEGALDRARLGGRDLGAVVGATGGRARVGAHQGVPGGRADHAVGGQPVAALEALDRLERAVAEATVGVDVQQPLQLRDASADGVVVDGLEARGLRDRGRGQRGGAGDRADGCAGDGEEGGDGGAASPDDQLGRALRGVGQRAAQLRALERLLPGFKAREVAHGRIGHLLVHLGCRFRSRLRGELSGSRRRATRKSSAIRPRGPRTARNGSPVRLRSEDAGDSAISTARTVPGGWRDSCPMQDFLQNAATQGRRRPPARAPRSRAEDR